MMLKNQRSPVPLVTLLLSAIFCGVCQGENDQFFEVELIAFTHHNARQATEQWPGHRQVKPPKQSRRITLNPPKALLQSAPPIQAQIQTPGEPESSAQPSLSTLPVSAAKSESSEPDKEFTALSDNELKLGHLVSSLRRKQLASRILLHTGWLQKIKPASATVPVQIEGGFPTSLSGAGAIWKILESYQENPPRPAGTMNLSIQPSFAQPPFAQPSFATESPAAVATENPNQDPINPSGLFAEGFELAGTLAFYETRYPRLETNLCLAVENSQIQLSIPASTTNTSSPGEPYSAVCSREIRGLKYGEVVYFDTPILGVLAQVRKVIPNSEALSSDESLN